MMTLQEMIDYIDGIKEFFDVYYTQITSDKRKKFMDEIETWTRIIEKNNKRLEHIQSLAIRYSQPIPIEFIKAA